MKKQNIMIGIGLLIVIVAVISLFVPYEKDTPRQIYAFDYGTDSQKELWNEESFLYLTADKASSAKLGSYETLSEREVYRMEDAGTLEWNFFVEEKGDYIIGANYMHLDEFGHNMEFRILIDGNPLHGTETVSLIKPWADAGEFSRTASGNEMRPRQSEVRTWVTDSFRAGGMDEIMVHLEKGNHTLTFINTEEALLLDYIRLVKAETKSYEVYIKEQKDKVGQQEQSKAGVTNYFKQLEAEVTYLKSSSEVYPVYDRSSPFTTPYHPTQLRMNTIGGSDWNKEGQWLEWEIEVEEDGYYKLGTRFRQNENKGMRSGRKILLDGELLFDELKEVKFGYNIGWQTKYLGGDNPYEIYLTAGKHYLRMEATLGSLKELVAKMEESVYQLNDIYRQIISITGTIPDVYRDYNLETAIPDLVTNMEKLQKELDEYEAALLKENNNDSSAIRIISQLNRQLQSFIKQPYTIQKRLSAYKTNIEAMAVWVFSFKEQPLELDAIYIAGTDAKLPKSDTSTLGKLGHEIRAFLGTFTQDYSDIAHAKEENTITIWVGRGRDYGNAVKRLVDEYFTPMTGIHVNVSLVDGALVKATIAGQGPDVNLFTSRGETMNLAFRNALEPLNGYEGYEELLEEFMDGATTPYEFNGDVYAIPAEQRFFMMFCRMDILDSLGLTPPATWEELMAMMPVLQGSNLSIGLPYADGSFVINDGIGMANLYPTLLAQSGISMYNEEKTKTSLEQTKAYEMFKKWTDFYTLYDFPLYKDDFNRFRTGEMPVLITNFSLYNSLLRAAPEISGRWMMTEIPGTLHTNGETNHSVTASGTATIMTKQAKNKNAAWEFINWWSSGEIQAMFAKEIETRMSVLARYTSANIKAFENSQWPDKEKEVLLKQWRQVKEVPEILGGYYTTRNVENAFRAVYFDGENARESLEYWNNGINEELERKQNQSREDK